MTWLAASLVLASSDWLAVSRGWRRARWATKPAVLLALLLWFCLEGGWRGQGILFGAGLLASLAGDIFLLFPRRGFLAGLAAFLVANICYTIGFQLLSTPLQPGPILAAAMVILLAARVFPPVLRCVTDSGRGKLAPPFCAYAAAISLMFMSALSTLFQPDWPADAAALAAAGGGLFFLSDSVLATHRFARCLPHGDLAIMVLYHLGQILLTGGVLLYLAV